MAIDYTKRPSSTPAPVQVSLSKVTLTKAAPTVSLTKAGSGAGTLRVNLNWTAQTQAPPARSGGLFKRSSVRGNGIDLDLGCLYEYGNGEKGVVQALGNAFRDKHSYGTEPIIWLDGDDRSGTNTEGENLFVNLTHVGVIRRILVFALIYEGVPNWAAADGVVTLFPAAGPEVEVRLDESRAGATMCGVALLENTGGELSVRREVTYTRGHRELDQAYGWGMNWTAGSK